MLITSGKGALVFKSLGWVVLERMANMFKFSRYVLSVFVVVLSIFILGAILFWTLDHTDIIAFVTVLLVAIGLETVVLFSLFNATVVAENGTGDQHSGITLILAKVTRLPKLVRKRRATARPDAV
jgi:hypothetical protein